uniref:Ribosomal protein S14 n=2 Tax=Reclinomonas americana TaxID=48483 RepID=M4QAD5_RECAM|nr:ribosomal protein S14 [Reclinomonas americana ATCC 50283]AGH24409.1 ribosomal protein S14 [Reclinomonas americana ATCC 50284]
MIISHFSMKDKKRRFLYSKYEWKRLQLKSIADNMLLPMEVRFKARLEINELPKDSSKVRIRNRCIMTGRPRGVYRYWRLSRIKIRELMAQNKIPGLQKSSW